MVLCVSSGHNAMENRINMNLEIWQSIYLMLGLSIFLSVASRVYKDFNALDMFVLILISTFLWPLLVIGVILNRKNG